MFGKIVNKILIVLAAILVLLILIIVISRMRKDSYKKPISEGPLTTPTTEESKPSPTEIPQSLGIIEGSLSYPSEEIPQDLEICAQNAATNKKYCTSQHIKNKKYTYGFGYQLEVPSGEYYVYAYPLSNPDFQAYFSEFVTCGLAADCPSHQRIKITVKEGQTTENIDPGDWYAF